MFTKRVISGAVLVVLALYLVRNGGTPLLAISLLLSILGLFELYRVFHMEYEPIAFVGYLATIIYYGMIWYGQEDGLMLLIIGSLMLCLAIFAFTYPKYKTEQVSMTFFGILYISIMLSFMYKVRMMNDGIYLVWLIFISAWGADTSAYVAGRLAGKHHIAPILSPKKTLEGCIGGVIGAAVLGGIYGMIVGSQLSDLSYPPVACAFACGISAILSEIGDFAASAIKRDHGVKDYGDLIPGHGGVLDRFDSMLFTSAAFYFAILFIKF